MSDDDDRTPGIGESESTVQYRYYTGYCNICGEIIVGEKLFTAVVTRCTIIVEYSLYSVCVCVSCHSMYFGHQACGRTSRGHTGRRSHKISHPPSFCGACLNSSREKDSAVPFPRRLRSRILCINESIVLHLLGIFYFRFLFFCEEKSQFV